MGNALSNGDDKGGLCHEHQALSALEQGLKYMKNIASIISAIKKNENAVIINKVTITNVTVGEADDNGRAYVICDINKLVPGMVQVNQRIIDAAEADAVAAEEAAAALKADATASDSDKKEANAEAKRLRKYADSLKPDEYVVGEVDKIFLSNFAFIGMMRQSPKLTTLTEPIQVMPELLKGLLNQATINVVAEKVFEGEEYYDPFSSNTEGFTVEHDSVFHSGYALALSEYGEDAADEIRSIVATITKERLMERLRGGDKKHARKHRPTQIDDDED